MKDRTIALGALAFLAGQNWVRYMNFHTLPHLVMVCVALGLAVSVMLRGPKP